MSEMPIGVMMSAGWTLDQLRHVRDLAFDNVQIHAPSEDVLEDPNGSARADTGHTICGHSDYHCFRGVFRRELRRHSHGQRYGGISQSFHEGRTHKNNRVYLRLRTRARR